MLKHKKKHDMGLFMSVCLSVIIFHYIVRTVILSHTLTTITLDKIVVFGCPAEIIDHNVV